MSGDEGPIRVQLSRTKGWRMPPNTLKVDRTTAFGNPWTVHDARETGYRGTDDELAAYCVSLFREFVTNKPGSLTSMLDGADYLRDRIHERLPGLRGKNLACWCKLPKPGEPDICHAAVLLELANASHKEGQG